MQRSNGKNQNQAFDKAIQNYADSVIEEEKKNYKPGFEPFAVHAGQMRERLTQALYAFQKSYANGYRVLVGELRKMASSNSDPSAIATPNNQKVLDDPKAFMELASQGKPIAEIIGFSNDAIQAFYSASSKLVQEGRVREAKDAFFFLVTIAPQIAEGWLGLGYSYGQCHEYEPAIQACLKAVELMPHKADSYLTFARLFIQMEDFSQAKQVCEVGLQFAKQHQNQPWSKDLQKELEGAREYISQLALKR